MKIKKDYSVLTIIIKKIESSKYSICEAYSDINKCDFKEDNTSIIPNIAKTINRNPYISASIELSRSAVSPAIYAALQQCQPISTSVERLFSMLNKLLAKD